MIHMTGIERTTNLLARKPVDRIGVFESFWGDTLTRWKSEGHIQEGESLEDHFNYDMQLSWPFNFTAKLDFEPETVEETEETILVRDGNGAVLRRSKTHDTTPEHVDFLVKDRTGWEEHIKPFLFPDRARINFEAYRDAKRLAAAKNRFFFWGGTNVFELMHPVCGHEYMLMGMAVDGLGKGHGNHLCRNHHQAHGVLFAEGDNPTVSGSLKIWASEPPLHVTSCTANYQPNAPFNGQRTGHARNHALLRLRGTILPGMIETGIDCLQVIEVKAGMDLCACTGSSDVLSFMGGMDVRILYTNDKDAVDRELRGRPEVMRKNGYMLHPTTPSQQTTKLTVSS